MADNPEVVYVILPAIIEALGGSFVDDFVSDWLRKPALTSSLWKFGSGCPPLKLPFTSIVGTEMEQKLEEFNWIQPSLDSFWCKAPLIGFSWNSKVLFPEP